MRNLGDPESSILIGNEGNIVKYLDGIVGGVELNIDQSVYTDEIVHEGHPVYKDTDGSYKLATITDGAYVKPATGKLVGVITSTMPIADSAFFPVTTRGVVTDGKMEVTTPDSIMAELPLIQYESKI